MWVFLFVDCSDMGQFPLAWNFRLIKRKVEKITKRSGKFIREFFEDDVVNCIWACGFPGFENFESIIYFISLYVDVGKFGAMVADRNIW
jgi:hypothetical protein